MTALSVNGAMQDEEDCFHEDTSNPHQPKPNLLSMLSDEILVDTLLKFLPDAKSFQTVGGVDKRCRSLVCDQNFIGRVFEARVHPAHKDLLGLGPGYEQLGFYQSVVEKGLFLENRIGFDFASTIIDEDNGTASQIQGSKTRVNAVGMILEQFGHVRCLIEAHCGTAAPARFATVFSRSRGEAVSGELIDFAIQNAADRVTMNPWGRRVTQRAALSEHKNGSIAREGRGWVEVYLVLDGLELPRRPPYYEGVQLAEEDDDEPFMFRILW